MRFTQGVRDKLEGSSLQQNTNYHLQEVNVILHFVILHAMHRGLLSLHYRALGARWRIVLSSRIPAPWPDLSAGQQAAAWIRAAVCIDDGWRPSDCDTMV